MKIGKQIRQLRRTKDWTLADLAKHSKVALSSLSRIETGHMTGTLESHIQIAQALGVRLPELYGELEPLRGKLEVREGADSSDRIVSGKGASTVLLTSGSLQKKMLPGLINLKPKSSSQPQRGPEGAERFFYVLNGQVEITVGSEKAQMKSQDSLYFLASQSHTLKNIGSKPAMILSVTCPPIA